jgi:hypothetical protein
MPARAGAVKVGRRTNLRACSAVARPHLDSSEHDGTLGAIGMTIRGEPAFGARINRATTLYPVGARTRTMMQLCASAAKLRDGGPILPFGMKAKETRRDPPPRTIIGDPSQADGPAETKLVGDLGVLRSLCGTQNDAFWHNALLSEPPQCDQKLAC